MKRIFTHLLAVSALVASAASFAGNHSNTIVDVASKNGSFTTLVAALRAADLVKTLQGNGPFTVFAPTDEAFAALPTGALDDLLVNPSQLAEILTLHVVAGSVPASDVVSLSGVETLQGKTLAINTTDGVNIGGANVVMADVDASNGVIHVIDRVILP